MSSKYKVRVDHHGRGIKTDIHKYKPPKVYGTGVDPLGSFVEFMKKDPRYNLHSRLETVKQAPDLEARAHLPAIGCTKKVRSESEIPTRAPVKYNIATDHVSFQRSDLTGSQPSSTKTFEKPKFYKSMTSHDGWVAPRASTTLSNCVSVNYNIISHQENTHGIVRKTTNIDARRCKGITEFSDKNNLFHTNINQKFQEAISEDPRMFHRKTGIFSHMYDASARQGNITMPFEKNHDTGGKPAFKC